MSRAQQLKRMVELTEKFSQSKQIVSERLTDSVNPNKNINESEDDSRAKVIKYNKGRAGKSVIDSKGEEMEDSIVINDYKYLTKNSEDDIYTMSIYDPIGIEKNDVHPRFSKKELEIIKKFVS